MERLVAGLIVGFILGIPFGRLVERANRSGSGQANGGHEQRGLLDELRKGFKAILIFVVLFAALAIASRTQR